MYCQIEVDPFLKAAWIVKESQGLFIEADYRIMMQKATEYLSVVIGKRGQVKGFYEQANALQHELTGIKMKYGWIE